MQKKGNTNGVKNNGEKKTNQVGSTPSGREEDPSEESLNQYMMRKNFKRLNSVVNYILIEIIQKTLYGDNRNAKTILQSLILDLIKCCDNPLFSISTLFVKNSIHIFFDVINKRHEGNVKETCLFILRYIFTYTFNIYNYVNDACFPLLHNLNRELCQNKFIKPLFQMDGFKEAKEGLSSPACITGGGKKKNAKGKKGTKKEIAQEAAKKEVLRTNGGESLPGEMTKLLRCCDEVEKSDQLLRCQQCESFYHKMCIYKDARKVSAQRDIPQEGTNWGESSLRQTGGDNQRSGGKKDSQWSGDKKDCQRSGNKRSSQRENLDEDTAKRVENLLHPANVAEYYCDNCKVRNIIKGIIIREAQRNNTFLNSKFRRKKEKNKGFYCFEKFVNKLKAFVVYYYYLVVHLKCDRASEGTDRNCNHVYSYILILYNDFLCADGDADGDAEGTAKWATGEEEKGKQKKKKKKKKEKEKGLPPMKVATSQKSAAPLKSAAPQKDSTRVSKFAQMLCHEYRNADRKDDEALAKCTGAHNFDIYIHTVWRIHLYFSFYEYFFVALNQLFYILYENGNKNLRYYSISIISNIISDNYLYLKCRHTQNILMSCLTDNYLKVREYTLYIYYNFCKTFLDVEKLSDWCQLIGGTTHPPLSSTHTKAAEAKAAEAKVAEARDSPSNEAKKEEINALDGKKRRNHYQRNQPVDLNQYITNEVVESIRRCSKDIKISIRIVSVKILKYLVYFNVYARRYPRGGAQAGGGDDDGEERHADEDRRLTSQSDCQPDCIRDNLSIVNDLIERYVSTFDNETMKSAVLETFIDIFFINIFTQAKRRMARREGTPEVDPYQKGHSYRDYPNAPHDGGYESEESQSVTIEQDSTVHIRIEKNMYTLFIHLLYVMKNKHNINIVSKMLSHMEKNVRGYDERLGSVMRFLGEHDKAGTLAGGRPHGGGNSGVISGVISGVVSGGTSGNFKPTAKSAHKRGSCAGKGRTANHPMDERDGEDPTEDEPTDDAEGTHGQTKEQSNLLKIKNSIYNIYLSNSYKYLEILTKKRVQYVLQIWIHNLICLFISSRRNSSLEKETKKIINIFNIIIEIMPSLFIKYMDFFYPYIYNNDVSKDVCELLSSIIPHCKMDLNLKFQFKRVHFNNSLLYHQNIFISRSYVQLLCTLHTYIFSDFFYFKTYIQECLMKLHKYKLCFLINNYVVQLNDFVRDFQFMTQEEKQRIRGDLFQAYTQTVEVNGGEEGDPQKGENHPDHFFTYNLIDMPYEQFVNHLDQYKKHLFDLFCVTHTDVLNLDKSAWLISVVMEFININKIVVNDVYGEGVDPHTHAGVGEVKGGEVTRGSGAEAKRGEVKGKGRMKPASATHASESNRGTRRKAKPDEQKPDAAADAAAADAADAAAADGDTQTNGVKYIKLSEIANRVQIYSQGILYFEFMLNKEVDYINKWKTLQLKNEIITEIIQKKINTKKIEKFVHLCNYKFYDISSIVVNLIVDLFYISNDVKYKCFFLLCLSKILSNFYNSHFVNDLKLRNVFFYCINSFNPVLQKNFLYTLLHLIKTYEQFLNNKDNLLLAQSAKRRKCESALQGGRVSMASAPTEQQLRNVKKGKVTTTRGGNPNQRNCPKGDSKNIHSIGRNSAMGNCHRGEPTNGGENLHADMPQEGDITRREDHQIFHCDSPNMSSHDEPGKGNHQRERIKREATLGEEDTDEPHKGSRSKGEKEQLKGDNSGLCEQNDALLMRGEQLAGGPNLGSHNLGSPNWGSPNPSTPTNGPNNDIIHVLLVASLFAQKIINLLSVNRFIYADCSTEELHLIKNLGIQILGNLYKEGFIQGAKICPSIFCLCFSPDMKLKCRSEKIINCILEKDSYNFVNGLAECLQHMLFYLIENHYMFSNFESGGPNEQRTNQMSDADTLLFKKMEQPFFQCLLDIYDRLGSKNLKMKYVKTVLKEIENACHLVLYDKVRSFIRDVGAKYSGSTGGATHGEGTSGDYSRRDGYNVNISVRIPQVKDIYSLILRKYMPQSGSSAQSDDPRDSGSDSSAPKRDKRAGSGATNGENHVQLEEKKPPKYSGKPNSKRMNKEDETSSCSHSKSSEKIIDDDISDVGTNSEQNSNEKDVIEKIKKKYHLMHHQMNVDEFTHINYFLFLYIQILIYLLSFLNFTTYNEMALLIHDINKVYYIISSTLNISSEVDSPKCNHSYLHSIDERMQELSHEDEMNNERESEHSSRVNLNLCKIKCFAMVLLNSLTNQLVRHYQVDTSRLNELIEEDHAKENKIEEELREEKKNVFNYFEYIYQCIEIFVEDNAVVMEKHARHNLKMHNLGTHNLNSDYINGLMNDGKNKKFAQKKKQREVSRQRRLTLKKNS
ncbi:hypothetical protein PVNG_05098 [Plasmodium vivax North Korean]|uniref:Uncharacterized protein n=1 Tax=Plasmodium vivax North Korean TaxID=1035514 RepID=A0A0J9TR91_PLAVI|nr:hypothetical protein PVNG_05098 [Plasmodium vivax North Korean]